MNYNHVPRKILITGCSGSGKTTLFLEILKGWKCPFKFVFDPEHEVSIKLGWKSCQTVREMNNLILAGKPVVFDGSRAFPGDRAQGFEFLCRYALEVSKRISGPKLLASDEIQDYQAPGREGLPQALAECADEGRRQELDWLFLAQGLNRINDVLRGQLTEIVTFAQHEPLQLDWLAERGFNPEEVKGLHYPGEFIRLWPFIRKQERGWTHGKFNKQRKASLGAGRPRAEAGHDSGNAQLAPVNG